MKADSSYIIGWVPSDMIELQVIGMDHQSAPGTVAVPWSDMQNFMLNITNGHQLGGVIKKIPAKK